MVKNRQKPRLRNQVATHAIDTVVPRKRNGYRPYMINRYGMAMIILMVFAVSISYVQQSTGVLGAQASIQPMELLEQVNTSRDTEDLPGLEIDQRLMKAAQAKASDMIEHQYWAHQSPRGATPWKWINEAGYGYAYAGENLAKNFATAGSTVAAWMASEGHRKNLMNENYTDAGFAVIDGELEGSSVTLIVGMFATPATSLTTVAGAKTHAPIAGSVSINPFARFGIILQSSSSTAVGIVALTGLASIVALVAFIMTHWQSFTSRRSKSVRRSDKWYKDRTATKLVILTFITIGVSVLLGSGQI